MRARVQGPGWRWHIAAPTHTNDTANSYLWHKVNGTQGNIGGDGAQMPKNNPALSNSNLNTIEDWINGGAQP